MYKLAKFLSIFLIVISTLVLSGTVFLVGYDSGYKMGKIEGTNAAKTNSDDKVSSATIPANTKVVYVTPMPYKKITWGGPDLWEEVNKRRVELGVGRMQVKEEVCTIASIRLNQLLALGTLDGHKGFTSLPDERPDLKWIFDKYNLSEFLLSGADTPKEAVNLWENTLGHKDLLSGGQYVWGCIYAQNGTAVAISAY
jgi:hypothetical protein